MRKWFLVVILGIMLMGCSISNTPTSKVEDLLGKYQMLDDSVNINYYDLSGERNISDDLQKEYLDLIKNQYQGLSYEIKEEVIDGGSAVVTASIEVVNYKDVINKYNKNTYQLDEYHRLVIDDLGNAHDMVTYTIDFTLIKDDNGNWVMDELSNEQRDKLLGIN